jgi:peroxiredoxin
MRLLTLLLACCALLAGGDLSNRRAPSFTLNDGKGNLHDLLDYRGNVVLIEFMQTNCPHCQVLAGTLERVKARYGDKLVVLGVVVPPDTDRTVANFIAQHKVTSPVLFDCGQMAASYLKPTPARPQISLPHLFVIDAQGWIRDDMVYSEARKAVFEGDGLYPIIDKALAPLPAAPKKK